MFSSAFIAASSNGTGSSGYSATLDAGTATDKAGTRYGFMANGNDNWSQQGSNAGSTVRFGGLDDVFVTLDGTEHRITFLFWFSTHVRFQILHPDQSSSAALPVDLFSSISVDDTTYYTNDLHSHETSQSWNAGYYVTTWDWQAANPFADTSVDRTITIEE